MEFIKSPEVWSAGIALLALVLSQLPPVHQLLRRRALRIVIPEYLSLYHFLGNINLLGFVALHNTGGKTMTVAKIDCIVTSEGAKWNLPGLMYQSRHSQGGGGQPNLEFFVEWSVLKPDEHWSETVHFFKPWTVQEEEDAAEIISKIRSNINTKIAQRPPDAPKVPVEADGEFVREAKEFFLKRFQLVKGNYRIVIAALSEKKEVLALRGFDFTLFDNHIKTLRSASDDYKLGAGIYYAADPSKQVPIRLRPISDADARQEYLKA